MHDGDSSITATYSIGKDQNNLGLTQPLSDGEPEPEIPEHKVKKVAFSSDEEFSPKAKNKPGVSLTEPTEKKALEKNKADNGEGEPRKVEDPSNDDEPNNEEESSSSSEEEEEMSVLEPTNIKVGKEDDANLVTNQLQKRISLYMANKIIASQVWCSILGLKAGISQPSQKQIESSPLFQLCGPKQGDKTISNISGHWVSLLADSKVLGDAPLGEFKPPSNWSAIYLSESLRKYAPDVVKDIWPQKRG